MLYQADAAGGGFDALGGVEFGEGGKGCFGFVGFGLAAVGDGELRQGGVVVWIEGAGFLEEGHGLVHAVFEEIDLGKFDERGHELGA